MERGGKTDQRDYGRELVQHEECGYVGDWRRPERFRVAMQEARDWVLLGQSRQLGMGWGKRTA